MEEMDVENKGSPGEASDKDANDNDKESEMLESESEDERNGEKKDDGDSAEEFDENEGDDEDFDEKQAEEEEEAEREADEAEVKAFETALAENPYDYASHVALIGKFRKMGELERLRAAREGMSSKYPLSPELWRNWISDEIKLATTSEQKAEVVKLCERAVKDYLSVEVWLEYLQYNIENMDTEKESAKNIRQLFERALTAAGLHTIKGSMVWETFKEFETVLYSLIDPGKQAERAEQLDRIGNLFRRQLACPLLDMERTFEDYEAWRKLDGKEAVLDDDIVLGGYERAFAKLNERLPFEEKIASAQEENELLDAYKAYLMYEKQHGDPGRVTVLYERAITDLSLETFCWLDYVQYLEDNIKIESILEPVYYRASRNIPWCAVIWQKWIRAYEKWGKPVAETQVLLENALTAGFSTADDYRNVWITYLEYLRRRIDPHSDDEQKQVETLRNAFNRACEHLAKSFGLEGDPNCVILQFWARTEAIHGNDMEKARTLWADILSQGHSGTASYWMEYISLERCYGDTKHLRKLYQKALTSVKDWPESVANSWIDFERDEGTLEQMELCEAKTKEKLAKVAEERQKAQTANHELSPSQNKKANKRKADDSGRWKNLGGSPSKITKIEAKVKPKIRESRLNIDSKASKEKEEKPQIAPPPGFKAPDSEGMEVENAQEMDDKITVFVSNLDYAATEEEVRNALEPAGSVTALRMIKDYKGRSKGYCYVQLTNAEAVEKALALDRTPIRGRPMFVSRCEADKVSRSSGFKYSSTLEKNKLFIKGLPVTTTKEQLEEIFKIHGALKDVRLVTYRNGHSKGLAYVEFEDAAAAAKALIATDGMKIEDKVISVAISKPPERKKAQAEETAQIKSLGGSSTSRAHFGAPKTLLSMVPRNVKTGTSNGTAKVTGGSETTQRMSNQDFRNMLLNKK